MNPLHESHELPHTTKIPKTHANALDGSSSRKADSDMVTSRQEDELEAALEMAIKMLSVLSGSVRRDLSRRSHFLCRDEKEKMVFADLLSKAAALYKKQRTLDKALWFLSMCDVDEIDYFFDQQKPMLFQQQERQQKRRRYAVMAFCVSHGADVTFCHHLRDARMDTTAERLHQPPARNLGESGVGSEKSGDSNSIIGREDEDDLEEDEVEVMLRGLHLHIHDAPEDQMDVLLDKRREEDLKQLRLLSSRPTRTEQNDKNKNKGSVNQRDEGEPVDGSHSQWNPHTLPHNVVHRTLAVNPFDLTSPPQSDNDSGTEKMEQMLDDLIHRFETKYLKKRRGCQACGSSGVMEMPLPTLHQCVLHEDVEGFEICLKSPLAMDFTVADEFDMTVLHFMVDHSISDESTRCFFQLLLTRLQSRPDGGDRIDWMQRDISHKTFLDCAALNHKLSVVWPLVQSGVPYFDDLLEPQVLRGKVWSTDLDGAGLLRPHATRSENSPNNAVAQDIVNLKDEARTSVLPPLLVPSDENSIIDVDIYTAQLCKLCWQRRVDPTAVALCIQCGADPLFIEPLEQRVLLHRFILEGRIDCVAACLMSPRSIDLSTTDTLGRTVLHCCLSALSGGDSGCSCGSGCTAAGNDDDDDENPVDAASTVSRSPSAVVSQSSTFAPLSGPVCPAEANLTLEDTKGIPSSRIRVIPIIPYYAHCSSDLVVKLLNLILDRLEAKPWETPEHDSRLWRARDWCGMDLLSMAAHRGLLSVLWPVLVLRFGGSNGGTGDGDGNRPQQQDIPLRNSTPSFEALDANANENSRVSPLMERSLDAFSIHRASASTLSLSSSSDPLSSCVEEGNFIASRIRRIQPPYFLQEGCGPIPLYAPVNDEDWRLLREEDQVLFLRPLF